MNELGREAAPLAAISCTALATVTMPRLSKSCAVLTVIGASVAARERRRMEPVTTTSLVLLEAAPSAEDCGVVCGEEMAPPAALPVYAPAVGTCAVGDWPVPLGWAVTPALAAPPKATTPASTVDAKRSFLDALAWLIIVGRRLVPGFGKKRTLTTLC